MLGASLEPIGFYPPSLDGLKLPCWNESTASGEVVDLLGPQLFGVPELQEHTGPRNLVYWYLMHIAKLAVIRWKSVCIDMTGFLT